MKWILTACSNISFEELTYGLWEYGIRKEREYWYKEFPNIKGVYAKTVSLAFRYRRTRLIYN